ncbi:MAG: hypothetical protein JW829_08425 [Pirellulales bacterium]|nr:hypothetical protein [Pirellulales bacterium]
MSRRSIILAMYLAIFCQTNHSFATLLRVDIVTGALAWKNTSESPLEIAAYSIRSASGNLVPENWISISGNYDIHGDSSVDPVNAWVVLEASSDNLAEFGGGSLGTGTLAPGQLVDLGAGVWSGHVPFDLVLEYVDGENQVHSSQVALGGADFDLDGDVDGEDFLIWQMGFGTESGALIISGDANADGRVDAADLAIWQDQFGTIINPTSLAAVPFGMTAIPEPSTWILAVLTFLFTIRRLPRRNR